MIATDGGSFASRFLRQTAYGKPPPPDKTRKRGLFPVRTGASSPEMEPHQKQFSMNREAPRVAICRPLKRSVMRYLATVATVLLVACATASAADWPTYMHDNARSGVTAESLRLPLSEQWVCRAPALPQPAWPDPQPNAEMHKMKFDDAFYTVAVGDTVYFGSSVDHQIYALDAGTGRVRWKFFTGGPVRLAPTVAGGRVYAGSDDGKVYCLAADDGRRIWEFDAAPEPRRVIGNGQIISLWPVRTGVLMDGERLFFGAGIFPYHSPTLNALDSKTGQPIPWKDHVDKDWIGLSPQGYLLRTSRGLVVPCGRTMPLVVDCDTGKQIFSVLKVVGFDRQATGGAAGDYGTVVGDVMHIGTQNTLYGIDVNTGDLRSRWMPVHRLVASPDSYYVFNAPALPSARAKAVGAEYEGITALDRALLDKTPLKDPAGITPSIRWRSPRAGVVAVILTGEHVIAGCRGEVAILSASDGKELWKAKVEGDAVGLTVANGRLLVSTTRGVIHGFAFGAAEASPVAVAPPVSDPDAAAVRQTAETIVRESGVRRGYALVSGKDAAALACELARQTELRITCIEPDPQQLPASRKRVDSTGLYGSRVTVQPATAEQFPYPDYAANLIVHMDAPGKRAPSVTEMLRVLKPCGGVVMMRSAEHSQVPDAWKNEGVWSRISAANLQSPPWTKFVRGKLEGSGWWTHAFADAGGSGSSGDQRVKGKLSVLWFGEPGAGEAVERHQRAMSPLASNGRVFFQGWGFTGRKNTIICFDAYNGLRYWEREIPGAVRVRLSAVSGNLACNDDSLFVAAGSKCERLDAITGVTKAIYDAPRGLDGTVRTWGHIAVADGILFGSTTTPDAAGNAQELRAAEVLGASNIGLRFSDAVFAFDLSSGKQLWVHRAKEIRDSTIVVNGPRLFFAENRGPATVLPKRSPDGGMFWHAPTAKSARDSDAGTTIKKAPSEPLIRTVLALESATGKIAWEKEVDLTDCGVWGASASTREAAGFRELQALCKDDVLMFVAEFNQHDGAKPSDLLRRRALTLSTRDGSPIWSKVVGNLNRPIILRDSLLAGNLLRDLRTGEPLEKYDAKTSKNVPWTVLNGGSCGTPSACDSMVFYRKGSTAWRSIDDGAGSQFLGIRPGCFINILPVGGVVVQPEASSGCTCNYSIQSTITFSPSRKE